jgi:hypothetical protein
LADDEDAVAGDQGNTVQVAEAGEGDVGGGDEATGGFGVDAGGGRLDGKVDVVLGGRVLRARGIGEAGEALAVEADGCCGGGKFVEAVGFDGARQVGDRGCGLRAGVVGAGQRVGGEVGGGDAAK